MNTQAQAMNPQGVPMLQQPQAPVLTKMANIPPGLEYLAHIDQLLVKQKMEMMEVMVDVEMANRYVVMNSMGQQVYYAKEDGNCCVRQMCGESRPFTINIEDNSSQEVIRVIRPLRCNIGQCLSCCSCCQDKVTVEAPVGVPVGYVRQIFEACSIRYEILDAAHNVVLKIHGPSFFHCFCPGSDIPFDLMTADGESKIGVISKQWGNLMKEIFTDADNFGIQFPMDLDIRIKAVVLGAVFLIDFMFFETSANKDKH